ncbi:MAG: transposase [Anaerocolumna sp.]
MIDGIIIFIYIGLTIDMYTLQSAEDEDAKKGHKSENKDFFGYMNHIAMSEEGIITGLTVTNGTSADNKEFENIINQTRDIGVEIKDVAGDKSYSTSDILKFGMEEDKYSSKVKRHVNCKEYSSESVSFNKDADTYECKNGCLAKKRKVSNRNVGGKPYNFLTKYDI